jgi:hypothetical protein
MYLTTLLSTLLPLSLLPQTLSAAHPPQQSTDPKLIHQYPNPTWLENIATTRHGQILTSVIGRPASSGGHLHLLDPSHNTTTLIAALPGVNSIFGISEYKRDVFAVIAGDYDTETGTPLGSWSIWGVDLRNNPSSEAPTFKIADLPATTVLANGLAALSESTLLVADSGSAHVISVSVKTGETQIAVADKETMSFDPEDAAVPIGINGMKYKKPYLYYTNSYTNTLYRLRVSSKTGQAAPGARPEVVASGIELPDDFSVGHDGTVWVAQPTVNQVVRIGRDGSVTTVLGAPQDRFIMGATSVALGRGRDDRGWGYVSTNGGLSGSVGGEPEGGKVVAFWLGA